jgi:hypothetical protein
LAKDKRVTLLDGRRDIVTLAEQVSEHALRVIRWRMPGAAV